MGKASRYLAKASIFILGLIELPHRMFHKPFKISKEKEEWKKGDEDIEMLNVSYSLRS